MVDGLQDDGLQCRVHLGLVLHHVQDGLQGVEETHGRDGLLVAAVCGRKHLKNRQVILSSTFFLEWEVARDLKGSDNG